jgi:hypothetical protein
VTLSGRLESLRLGTCLGLLGGQAIGFAARCRCSELGGEWMLSGELLVGMVGIAESAALSMRCSVPGPLGGHFEEDLDV